MAGATVIDAFAGPYNFLSNFYPSKVVFDGVEYPTVEHAYQAAKTADATERERIRACPTPGKAKRMGRTVTLRDDWEKAKVPVMNLLLERKFQDPVLRQKLLDTGSATLAEGNDWGDTFWGTCYGHGQNMLGELLMAIRDEIRSSQ